MERFAAADGAAAAADDGMTIPCFSISLCWHVLSTLWFCC
jgi:hypothetical protein